MPARLRTDFWVAALRRRAENGGAFVSIPRRGAEEAGAIFILVDRLNGRVDLYGPAPQTAFGDEGPADRLFSLFMEGEIAASAQARMEQELRFDPDLWLIEIEDKQGRPFVDLAPD